MKKLCKILLYLGLTLIVLVVIAVSAITYVFDPNTFKQPIAEAVYRNTGRQLDIQGDLTWQFYPRLGFKIGPATLSNPESFTQPYFASIKHANASIQLLPLLSKQVQIASLKLDGLDVQLRVSREGKNNWDSMLHYKRHQACKMGSKHKQDAAVVSGAAAHQRLEPLCAFCEHMQIGAFAVSHANITLDNAQSKQHFTIKNLDLHSRNVVFGSAFPIHAQLDFTSSTPDIAGSLQVESGLSIDNKGRKLRVAPFTLRAKLAGKDVPGETQTLNVDLDQVDMALAPLHVLVESLDISNENVRLLGHIEAELLNDKPVIKANVTIPPFDLRQYFKTVQSPFANVATKKAFKRFFASADVVFKDQQVTISPLNVELDEARMQGNVTIPLQAKANHVISFRARIDNIDIDQYIPPTSQSSSKTGKKEEGKTSAQQSAQPFKTPFTGAISVGRLKVAHLLADNVKATVSSQDGVIRVSPVSAQLYKGQYQGALTINSKQNPPEWQMTQTLKNINIQPLLVDLADFDKVSGLGQITMQMTGKGVGTTPAVRKSLNGKITLNVQDGIYHGIDVAYYYALGSAILQRDNTLVIANQKQTPFLDLSAAMTVGQGLVRNQDLQAYNRAIFVRGQGSVDLLQEQINYTLLANKSRAQTVNQKTTYHPSGHAVPIKLTGSLSNIKVGVDEKQLGQQLLESFGSKLIDKYQKKQDKPEDDSVKQPKQLFDQLFQQIIPDKAR